MEHDVLPFSIVRHVFHLACLKEVKMVPSIGPELELNTSGRWSSRGPCAVGVVPAGREPRGLQKCHLASLPCGTLGDAHGGRPFILISLPSQVRS